MSRWAILFLGAMTGFSHLNPGWGVVCVPLGISGFLYFSQSAPKAPWYDSPWRAWLFAFGYLAASLWWLPKPFTIHLERHWWCMPLFWPGVPAFKALFFAIPTLVIPWMRVSSPVGRVALASFCWLLFELLHGYFLLPCPWPLLAYGLALWDCLNQLAYLGTSYGFSVVIFWMGSLPYLIFRKAYFTSITLVISIGIAVLWGHHHMATTPAGVLPPLKIIQPGIPLTSALSEQMAIHHLARLKVLSTASSSPLGTLLIWPEGALLAPLEPKTISSLLPLIPEKGHLITGGDRWESIGKEKKHYNSLFALNSQGEVVATYDKNRFVPFGEEFPFGDTINSIWPGLVTSLVETGQGKHCKGKDRSLIKLSGVGAFVPLICFESIFPKDVVRDPNNPPSWILIISNDSWIRGTPGQFHLWQMARFRAIEENLPLVRAAQVGISGIIDGHGRVIKMLGAGQKGVLSFP